MAPLPSSVWHRREAIAQGVGDVWGATRKQAPGRAWVQPGGHRDGVGGVAGSAVEREGEGSRSVIRRRRRRRRGRWRQRCCRGACGGAIVVAQWAKRGCESLVCFLKLKLGRILNVLDVYMFVIGVDKWSFYD